MHKHLRLALATASATALTGGLLTFSAATATATDSVHHPVADFDDDGYGDVAYSAPVATVDGRTYAGQIVALYGSASGVTSTNRTTISQNTPGIPGSAEQGDRFGGVSAYGDFNGDGFDDTDVTGDGKADLTVGRAGENGGNGSVVYLPSNGTRTTTTGTRSIAPSSVGVSTHASPNFGGEAAN